jgi:arylsulfatase A-like enzyme
MSTRPNIIIMYADDLGFGDVGCYGATTIPTPNIDRLGAGGLRFTQAYATAATCTPSRYSLLAGSYPWRNPDAAILPGDAPLIFSEGETTIASVLKDGGYRTGVVGKWHLGIGAGNLDWNRTITPGPKSVGFDHSYIMAATNDRVPCVFVENGNVVGLDPADPIEVTYGQPGVYPDVPTGREHPELLRMHYSHGHDGTIVNGVSRIGEMRGGTAALWKDEEMAEVFVEQAKRFVSAAGDEPFFLYYAFHQPHVPRLPSPRFKGATPHGPRGDVIAEMDWCVGELVGELERLGILDTTMIVFTSDNGPVLDDGYQDQAPELAGEHRPAGPLRGGKYSLYDGGTRVPFIVHWPGSVEPGETDALFCQSDILASVAQMLDLPVPAGAAPDSMALAGALLGTGNESRTDLVLEGMQGRTMIRSGDWTYIPPHQGPAVSPTTAIELGNSPDEQLYLLTDDIGQIRNRAPEEPERVREMGARLEEILGS